MWISENDYDSYLYDLKLLPTPFVNYALIYQQLVGKWKDIFVRGKIIYDVTLALRCKKVGNFQNFIMQKKSV